MMENNNKKNGKENTSAKKSKFLEDFEPSNFDLDGDAKQLNQFTYPSFSNSDKTVLIEEVKELINTYTKSKDISKNDLAKMLNISSATLSNIENDYEERVNEGMLIRIKNALTNNDITIIRTANLNTIYNACNCVRQRAQMVGIVGYEGAGKSVALKAYYRRNPDTYMITIKKSMSARQFVLKLIKELGISFYGTTFEMMERICLELNSKSNPLLIIDEAGKLSAKTMLYLHDIRDNTDRSAGIVLAGVDYFKTNLEKAVRNRKEGMPEFYDRISVWQHLNRPTKQEIEVICKENNITDGNKIEKLLKVDNYRKLGNCIKNITYKQIGNSKN